MPPRDDKDLLIALHTSLKEDLGTLPDPGLARALQRLGAVEGPGAEPDRLARMLAAVRQAQDVETARNPVPDSTVTGYSLWLAVRAQVKVVRLPLIGAAVQILLLGIVFGPLWLQPVCTPLLALAPPIAVLGVGYAFRSLDDGMSELECAKVACAGEARALQ
ncbi:MAG: hypothetical protein JWO59_578 [Chloroflexi bacterium]|nr:hypothetical protein [Chloroflexota bacterium]